MRKLAIRLVLVVAAGSFLRGSSLNAQQDTRPAPDKGGKRAEAALPEKTGIAVGEKAPVFALQDQTGQVRRLEEWTRDGQVALVFFRSASW